MNDDPLQRHRQLLAAACVEAAIEMALDADEPPSLQEIAEAAVSLADAIIEATQS